MLIATAGHIDHGKTALVRALTGADTDRLPEEKARGISIDLGFAYWRPEGGELIGFVDVPGHERYLAQHARGGVRRGLRAARRRGGRRGDAADGRASADPRPARHRARLRGADQVRQGADPRALARCANEIAALLAPTGLAGLPVFPVSAVSGAGVDALGAALREAARQPGHASGGRAADGDRPLLFTSPAPAPSSPARCWRGRLATGDHLVLSPSGRPARVRGLQSAGRAVERGARRPALRGQPRGNRNRRGPSRRLAGAPRARRADRAYRSAGAGSRQPRRSLAPRRARCACTSAPRRCPRACSRAASRRSRREPTASSRWRSTGRPGRSTACASCCAKGRGARLIGGGRVIDPLAPVAPAPRRRARSRDRRARTPRCGAKPRRVAGDPGLRGGMRMVRALLRPAAR